MGASVADDIGNSKKGYGSREKKDQPDLAFGPQHIPEINTAHRDEESEIHRCVGEPAPCSHKKPVHPDTGSMLAWRLVERHQSVCQPGFAGHNGCFMTAKMEAHRRCASGDRNGNDKFLFFDEVLN